MHPFEVQAKSPQLRLPTQVVAYCRSWSSVSVETSRCAKICDKVHSTCAVGEVVVGSVVMSGSSSMWVTHFTRTQSALQVSILQFLGVQAQHYAVSLCNIVSGQEGYHPFMGLEEFAKTLNPAWTIPTGVGLPPICSECRQPYTLGTDRGYTPVDPSAAHPDIARLLPERMGDIKAALGEAHHAFTQEARNGIWGCQHCVHCIDQGIAKQVQANATSIMDQSHASKEVLETVATKAAEATMNTILAHLLVLRRYPAKKGPWKLALMPPPPQSRMPT